MDDILSVTFKMEPTASSALVLQKSDEGQPSNDHATRLVFDSGAFLCLFWRIFNGFGQTSKSIDIMMTIDNG